MRRLLWHIDLLQSNFTYFSWKSDANVMFWGEWYPCLICCFFESQNWRGEAQILDIHIHATLHKQGWHTFDATKIECWLQFVCLLLRLLICFPLKSVVLVFTFTSEDPCASFNVRDHELVLRISIFSLSCPLMKIVNLAWSKFDTVLRIKWVGSPFITF